MNELMEWWTRRTRLPFTFQVSGAKSAEAQGRKRDGKRERRVNNVHASGAVTPQAEVVARILGLPLSRLDACLEVRVGWLEQPLWFVPAERDAAVLSASGISRGRIWTAGELAEVLALPGVTPAAVRTVAHAKLEFQGEVIAVQPAGHREGCDCRACVPEPEQMEWTL